MVFHRRSGSGTVSSSNNGINEEELLFSNVIIRKNDHIQHGKVWPPSSSANHGRPESFNDRDNGESDESSSSFFDCHSEMNFLPTCGQIDTTTCGSPGSNNSRSDNQIRRKALLRGSSTVNTATINPYHVLQVRHDATKSEIKLAYRRLALFHHPRRKLGLSCLPTQPVATSTSNVEQQLRKKYVFEVLSACYETLICPESRRRYDIELKLGTAASMSSTNGSLGQRVRYNTILQKGLPAGEMFVGGKRIVNMVNSDRGDGDPSNRIDLNDVDAFYRHGYYGGSSDNNSNAASNRQLPHHTINTTNSSGSDLGRDLLLQRSSMQTFSSETLASYATDFETIATKSLLTVAEEEDNDDDIEDDEDADKIDYLNSNSLENQHSVEPISPIPPLSRASSQSSVAEDEDRMKLLADNDDSAHISNSKNTHLPDLNKNIPITSVSTPATNMTATTTCSEGCKETPPFIAGCTGGGGGCNSTNVASGNRMVNYLKGLFKTIFRSDTHDEDTDISTDDDESNASSHDEEPDIHYTQADTNRLFGGPLAPLYRARKYQQFTDPYIVFQQVFGSNIFQSTRSNSKTIPDSNSNNESTKKEDSRESSPSSTILLQTSNSSLLDNRTTTSGDDDVDNRSHNTLSQIKSIQQKAAVNTNIISNSSSCCPTINDYNDDQQHEEYRHKMMIMAMETAIPDYIMHPTTRVAAWMGSSLKSLDGTKIFTVSRVYLNRKVTRTVTIHPLTIKALPTPAAAVTAVTSITSQLSKDDASIHGALKKKTKKTKKQSIDCSEEEEEEEATTTFNKRYYVRSSEVTVTAEDIDPTPGLNDDDVIPIGCAAGACLALNFDYDNGESRDDDESYGSGRYYTCFSC